MLSNRFWTVALFFLMTAPWLSLPASASGVETVKVAVLPFAINAGDDLSYLEDSLPELLADRLREAGFEIVAPEETVRLIQEKGVAEITPAAARELSRLTGAGFSIHGSLNQIGDNLTIDARLVDAFAGDAGKKISVSEQGLINLLPAIDTLVERMRMDLLRLDIIAEVDVEGTQVLDKDVVLMRLTLQRGDMLTPKSVNTALKNIYDLGYFDDVTVKVENVPDGKRVIFDVEEKPRIQALGVRGADEIDSEDIIEAVSTKKGGVVNPKVLSDDIRVIREMYRKEGYYKAVVTHEIESTGTGVARLTFIVDEGPKLYIQNVVIDGAEQLDPDDVKEVLALQERGFLSWITDSGVLKEELLERDAAAIQAFYNSKGFIDVRVGRPEVEITDDGIDVIYQVWEGDRYKMGETLFKGDLIDDVAILKGITSVDDLKAENEYFDRSLLKRDIDRLTVHYNNYGYAYADIGVNLKDDPQSKIVDVEYNVSKHQRVHIRRVLIEGNTSTRDNVILRKMRLADGDMFSGEKLNRSHQLLNTLGYFEKVDISPVPTGNPEEMDLVVKVKDKPTGRIGGGVGYSTYDSVYLAADITETNLFGKGYQLGLNGAFSGTRTAFTLSFKNPHIYDTEYGFSASTHHRIEEFSNYDRDSTGGAASLFYPIGDFTNVSWSYAIDAYEIKNVDDSASDTVKDDEGTRFLSKASGAIVRNTLNSRVSPTEGTVTSLSINFGGGPLGGTDDFVKWIGAFDWYTPVLEEVVFRSKFWVGFLHQNFGGSDVPTAERFELGGVGTVRGYSSYAISPLDAEGASEGGTKAFYTNLELRRPISKELGISALVFMDAGNSWKQSEFFFSSPVRDGESPTLGLYKSVGGGVNWYSPMGPIGFVYGYGLDEIGTSGRHKFELLMGQQF